MIDKKLFEYIERHEDENCVKQVLLEETSFKAQVRDFYGVDEHPGNFLGCPENEGKEFPKDLGALLDQFNTDEARLDFTKLSYDRVKEDYQIHSNPLRLLGCGSLFIAGVLGFSGGFLYTIGSVAEMVKHGDLTNVICGGIVTCVGLGMYFGSFWKGLHPKYCNGGIEEFRRADWRAESADKFMKNKFMPYFVKRTLED